MVAGFILAACADQPAMTPASRAVHVSGVSCGEPREGMGVSLGGGLVLTSGHVVDGTPEVDVLVRPGEWVRGRVIHLDRVLDVSIIEASVPPSIRPEIVDAATGSTGTIHLVDTDGTRSTVHYVIDRKINALTLDVGRNNDISRPSHQMNAVLERGDSGAAMWDEQGRIVGVVWAISTSSETKSFAVQGDVVATAVRDALENPDPPERC